MQQHERFMRAAIAEARKARAAGDYAIGAVVVFQGKILGTGRDRIKTDQDPTAHAEIVAIRAAARALGSRHLSGAVLYCTHEPCPMCAAAAAWARMAGIVFGARWEDMRDFSRREGTAAWSWRTIPIPAKDIAAKADPPLFVQGDVLRLECRRLFHTE